MPGQPYLAGRAKLKQRKGTDVKTAFVFSFLPNVRERMAPFCSPAYFTGEQSKMVYPTSAFVRTCQHCPHLSGCHLTHTDSSRTESEHILQECQMQHCFLLLCSKTWENGKGTVAGTGPKIQSLFASICRRFFPLCKTDCHF